MPKRKNKILLVEDDSMQEMMYRVELENFNYNVFSADQVGQAYQLLMKNKPNLTLLDLLLAEESKGTDLLIRLNEENLIDKHAVVVMTNFTKKGVKEECLELGARDFIIKSEFTPRQLIEKITEDFLK